MFEQMLKPPCNRHGGYNEPALIWGMRAKTLQELFRERRRSRPRGPAAIAARLRRTHVQRLPTTSTR